MKVTVTDRIICKDQATFRYKLAEGTATDSFIKQQGNRTFVVFSQFDVSPGTELDLPEADLQMSTFTNAPSMLSEEAFAECLSRANESQKRFASLSLQNYAEFKANTDVSKSFAEKLARMSSQLTRAERNTGEVAKIKLQFAAETSRTNITEP